MVPISVFLDKNDSPIMEITLDGYFKKCIEKQLVEEEVPDKSISEIFQNAVDTLSNCPNPNIESKSSKTGIIIGKVQSGKTSNFLSFLAVAFDNNYKIAVVLGGNTKNLLKQNTERINGYFKDALNDEKIAILSTDKTDLLDPDSITQLLNMGKNVLIVGLKHQNHIDSIRNIFTNSRVANVPTIILDDEGDQATLNTKYKTEEFSKIYESVIKLRDSINTHCFISVTATPQANILISTFDKLHPDFGILVNPGDGYCGLNEFHGEFQDKYVKVVSDDDGTKLLDEEGIPDSLKDALAAFFVGGSIRLYREGEYKFKHSMLIHPDVRKNKHELILSLVKDCIEEDWRERVIAYKSGDDDAYNPLKKRLLNAYTSFVNDGVACPQFEMLENDIFNAIENVHIHLCNSDKNASSDSLFFDFNIFVGGNMLGRGITLPKLAVSYITRRAKGKGNVDNTEQRARWFGYRKNYLDVCRVYATDNIKKDFAAILEHEDDVWDTIERSQRCGLPFKELPRIFKLPSKLLRPTRISVAKTVRMDFSAWATQGYLSSTPEIVNENEKIINDYIISHNFDVLSYNEYQTHKISRNNSYFDLFDELLSHFKFPTESSLNYRYLNNLKEALYKSKDKIGVPLVDVVILRYKSGEERTIDQDLKINQLFQGRNDNKDPSKSYPGDRGIANDEVFQLQIHYVRPKNYDQSKYINNQMGTPVLSLHIPIAYSDIIDKVFVTSGEEIINGN